jgi:hypothetical protein
MQIACRHMFCVIDAKHFNSSFFGVRYSLAYHLCQLEEIEKEFLNDQGSLRYADDVPACKIELADTRKEDLASVICRDHVACECKRCDEYCADRNIVKSIDCLADNSDPCNDSGVSDDSPMDADSSHDEDMEVDENAPNDDNLEHELPAHHFAIAELPAAGSVATGFGMRDKVVERCLDKVRQTAKEANTLIDDKVVYEERFVHVIETGLARVCEDIRKLHSIVRTERLTENQGAIPDAGAAAAAPHPPTERTGAYEWGRARLGATVQTTSKTRRKAAYEYYRCKNK